MRRLARLRHTLLAWLLGLLLFFHLDLVLLVQLRLTLVVLLVFLLLLRHGAAEHKHVAKFKKCRRCITKIRWSD